MSGVEPKIKQTVTFVNVGGPDVDYAVHAENCSDLKRYRFFNGMHSFPIYEGEDLVEAVVADMNWDFDEDEDKWTKDDIKFYPCCLKGEQ